MENDILGKRKALDLGDSSYRRAGYSRRGIGMTLNEINREIQAKAPHVTLYRGKGYLYYIYDDGQQGYESHSVMVPFIYMQKSTRWIREGIEFSEKTEVEIAERKERASGFRGGPFAMFASPPPETIEVKTGQHRLAPHHRALGLPVTRVIGLPVKGEMK
jgi:hypothetical protein